MEAPCRRKFCYVAPRAIVFLADSLELQLRSARIPSNKQSCNCSRLSKRQNGY